MRALNAILLALALWSLNGCNPLEGEGDIRARVRNASDRTFDHGKLYLVGDSILFQGLAPGQTTPYREVEIAYEYATTQVVTGTDTFRIQVRDYVGSIPLDDGRYTYAISFSEQDPSQLAQELRKNR